MIKVIIFDFDGVIVDSVDVKAQAFVSLFEDCAPAVQQRVADYHRQHAGMSRYVKIRELNQLVRGISLTDTELAEQVERFAHFCFERVVRAASIAGADEFISTHTQQYALYIASATPEQELRAIVERRNLHHYFRGVYGTPRTKTEICAEIVQQNGYDPREVVVIGDSLSDYHAALACRLHFVGRLDATIQDPLAACDIPFKVCDLTRLHAFLTEHFPELPLVPASGMMRT